MTNLNEYLTPYQQLALIGEITGTKPVLRPYDRIQRVLVEDERVGLQVQRFRVTERSTSTLLTSATIVMQVWDLRPEGWVYSTLTMDDDTFKPLIISHRGGLSLDEWKTRNNWEALCYRPGNGQRLGQRDYDQVQRQTDTEWMKVNN